jgi:hypothetical protein
MTTLDLKAAFFHVIDDHRWLAASGCAWNLVGPNAANGTKNEAHQLLPNVDVMILDSLLLHARSLIDFYTKRQAKPRATDIYLSDFSVSIDPRLCQELTNYKKSVEVHLLHLTDWRDREYRDLNATGKDAKKGRPDWNKEAVQLVDSIFQALKCASEQTGRWQPPFQYLYNASTARYRDKMSVWPVDLCEKSDVDKYLTNLRL